MDSGFANIIIKGVMNCDGGSRGNPGPSGIGYTLEEENIVSNEKTLVSYGGWFIGHATNNQAEYHAFIWGVENALMLNVRTLQVFSDSELMVKQLNGEYRVMDAKLKPLYREATNLLKRFVSVEITHHLRAESSDVDKLANEAMNVEAAVGNFHVEYYPAEALTEAAPNLPQQAESPLPPMAEKPSIEQPVQRQKVESLVQGQKVEPLVQGQIVGPPGQGQKVEPLVQGQLVGPPGQGQMAESRGQGQLVESRVQGQIVEPPAQGQLALNVDGGGPAVSGKGTYYLSVREHFDAAHALIGYDGECKNLHGHTWDIDVEVKGRELDTVGIVYDFKDLKDNLKEILSQYDHKYLNEVPPFDGFNATAENLARVVYGQLAGMLPEGVTVVEVAVWESPIARLAYRED
jgi:6-pyruvoyltetrahydropterin/6-carboxytetrahydropterin synthase